MTPHRRALTLALSLFTCGLSSACVPGGDGAAGSSAANEEAAPRGSLGASPAICTIPSGASTCASTISWHTSYATDVKVKIGDSTFAAAAEGAQLAPWISETPAVFELWGDGLLLDTLTVVGAAAATAPPGDDECVASDAATLRACLQGLLGKSYRAIAITNDIVCSGPQACHLGMDGFVGPALVYGRGSAGRNPRLIRTDHFDYPIVDLAGSTDLELRDLDFVEGAANQPAGLFRTPGYDRNLSCDVPQAQCATTIAIVAESKRILIDHVSVEESKSQGISLGNVEGVTIRNSTIRHAWANGIWTTSGDLPVVNEHVPTDLRLENNTFVDNRCSAIEMSAQGHSVVSGNYLSHNHMGSIYGFPGGQLAIEARTTSLLIVDNEVANGAINEDPVLASQGWMTVGIELTDSNVRGVTIAHNHIHNNSGGAIIHDPSGTGGAVGFGVVTVSGNVFANNPPGDLFNFAPREIAASGNCSGIGCTYQRALGHIASDQPACTRDAVTGVCALTLSWSSTPALVDSDIRVLIAGSTFAHAASGAQLAPWISGPARFDLYDRDTLLDSVRVGAR